MKYFVICITLLAFIYRLHAASQNLCADARSKGHTFAADPANCSRYLYCDEASGITYELECEPEFPTFKDDFCTQEEPTCTVCPALDISVMYATSDDCKSFELCRGTNLGAGSCTGTLKFDRNSGVCVDESLVRCLGEGSASAGANCTGKDDGTFVLVTDSCTQYVLCYGGVVDMEFECQPGTHFDETVSSCIPEEESTCGQVETTTVEAETTTEETTTLAGRVVFAIWGEERPRVDVYGQNLPPHIPRAKRKKSLSDSFAF